MISWVWISISSIVATTQIYYVMDLAVTLHVKTLLQDALCIKTQTPIITATTNLVWIQFGQKLRITRHSSIHSKWNYQSLSESFTCCSELFWKVLMLSSLRIIWISGLNLCLKFCSCFWLLLTWISWSFISGAKTIFILVKVLLMPQVSFLSWSTCHSSLVIQGLHLLTMNQLKLLFRWCSSLFLSSVFHGC